jgi:quercetin dioxygenase-like cupin family protein
MAMHLKIISRLLLLTTLLLSICPGHAQVQVSKEPYHRQVMENEYLRLLNVMIQPGDTTQFHIHSTPSLFLHLSNTNVATQEQGKEWEYNRNTLGNAWYRPFSPDPLIHRVANIDSLPMHVIDVEILGDYSLTRDESIEPIPIPVTFENEKAWIYTATSTDLKDKKIADRGPIVATVVMGQNVVAVSGNQIWKLDMGEHIYFKPGSHFYFSFGKKEDVKLVLFELK